MYLPIIFSLVLLFLWETAGTMIISREPPFPVLNLSWPVDRNPMLNISYLNLCSFPLHSLCVWAEPAQSLKWLTVDQTTGVRSLQRSDFLFVTAFGLWDLCAVPSSRRCRIFPRCKAAALCCWLPVVKTELWHFLFALTSWRLFREVCAQRSFDNIYFVINIVAELWYVGRLVVRRGLAEWWLSA